jgi:hypothetical protein
MGSLFALGGLMKIEAKSYLRSISERRDDFVFACPLVNPDSDIDKQDEKKLKALDETDIHFFENDFISIT